MGVTKKDIVNEISSEVNLTQRMIRAVLMRYYDILKRELKNNNRIEIRNVGVWKTKLRKPKIGRNPKTGDVVLIPERRVIVFKAGKEFKEAVGV